MTDMRPVMMITFLIDPSRIETELLYFYKSVDFNK